ncbi:MAG: site-specific integrase [Clostridia bacterium]|nr:site-specific integrase [Clostridia bacterium]
MGSLQIKNGRYYGSVYVPAKKKLIQRALGISINEKSSEKKALKALARLEIELRKSNGTEMTDISFVDFLEKWLESTKDTYKPSTWEGYEKNVHGKIKPYFEPKKYKLKDLKGMYFTEYFSFLKANGKSNGKGGLKRKSIMNIRGVLSAAFEYAVANDMIDYNYIERSTMPKFYDVESEEKQVVYTPHEIAMLLTYARETESKMLLFLNLAVFTGARKGEILGLTWDCIDFKNSVITIKQNRTGSKKSVLSNLTTPKSKNSTRLIPVRKELLDMLSDEKQKQNEMKKLFGNMYINEKYDYVIRKDDGSIYNPNSINRIIMKMEKEIGLPPCRIHDFRHSFASILFDSGIELREVTTLLGHGQTSTTEKIYVHRKRCGSIDSINAFAQKLGI